MTNPGSHVVDTERGDADGELVRVLDDDGTLLPDADVPDLSDDELVGMYRDMRLARRFDERVVSLQRQGRIGTYAPLAGQEGSQVGSTYALREDDHLVYQYREHAALIARGFPPAHLAYWMGHEAGNEVIADRGVFPLNICIADHLPHAVGMAWAGDYRGDDAVVCVHFGDGATSEGDFHEALNFAGVFDTPNVFLCHNNQWAISVPAERQTASRSFAVKASAYGFDGVRVDGMDPLAVYAVTREAARKARDPADGEPRPTLIEAVEYRFGAHTTADDPSAYRDDAEVERWREKDPIPRLERFLRETGRLDDEVVDAIETSVEEELADIVEGAESFEADPDEMFEFVYESPTPELERQRDAFAALRERHGDDAFLRE